MSEEKHTPLSDTIHNLNVVRDALEAEGLTVHVKLIDQAIEDISSPPQGVRVSKEEQHAIDHARYQVSMSSQDQPNCCFDYELVKDLLRVIDRNSQAGSAQQAVQLPPIPIHWARPKGDTFDEMRDNVWKTGLATGGDTILIWVNEGDFLHAQIVFGAVEYPQISHNTQAGSDDVAVPKAALDWLFGESPDAEGKWFGKCEEDVTQQKRIFPPKYWWRSKFRSMIPTLSRPERGGG